MSQKTEPAAPGTSGNRRTWDAQSLALVAVFAALIAASALAPGIPVGSLGVPITVQTLAVALTALVLGASRAAAAVGLYLVLGFAGLPIFSGGRAGLQILAGGSAGYIVAFFVGAFVLGALAQLVVRRAAPRRRTLWFFLAATAVSIVIIHAFGVLGMMVNLKLSWQAAFVADLVYYPGDILKNVVAALAATAVHRAFPDVLVRRIRRA